MEREIAKNSGYVGDHAADIHRSVASPCMVWHYAIRSLLSRMSDKQ
jgi:uncharacterized protein YvpB